MEIENYKIKNTIKDMEIENKLIENTLLSDNKVTTVEESLKISGDKITNLPRFCVAISQKEEGQHNLANFNYNLSFSNQDDSFSMHDKKAVDISTKRPKYIKDHVGEGIDAEQPKKEIGGNFLSIIEKSHDRMYLLNKYEKAINISLCQYQEQVMLRMLLNDNFDIIFYFDIDKSSPPIKIPHSMWRDITESVGHYLFSTKVDAEYRNANLSVKCLNHNFENIITIKSWHVSPFYAQTVLEKLKFDFNESKKSPFRFVNFIGNLPIEEYTNDKNYFLRILRDHCQIHPNKYSETTVDSIESLKFIINTYCFNPSLENNIL